MPFRATRLASDGYLLRRAKVDVSKLRPDAVAHGAKLLRKLVAFDMVNEGSKRRDPAGMLEHEARQAWSEWRRAKGVLRMATQTESALEKAARKLMESIAEEATARQPKVKALLKALSDKTESHDEA